MLSLILSYLLTSLEQARWADPMWGRLLGNLFMLQDFGLGRPGVWVDQYYNLVFWSLSYEAWFYALFFALVRHHFRAQSLVAITVGVTGFAAHYWMPNQISYFALYFLIWWAGAAMATGIRDTGTMNWSTSNYWVSVMVLGALLWLPALLVNGFNQGPGLYPLVDIRRFMSGAAILMAATWTVRSWDGLPGAIFRASIGRFAWLGPYSYALYISHFPVIHAAAALFPGMPVAVGLPLLTAAALALAWVLERRVQPLFNQWLG